MAELLKETSAIKEYWLEPDSRRIEPETLSVTNMSGKVIDTVPYSERAGLELRMSPTTRTAIMADFGREVGGHPRVTFGTGRCRRVGVQAAESITHIFNPLLAEPVSLADYVVYYRHFKVAEGKPSSPCSAIRLDISGKKGGSAKKFTYGAAGHMSALTGYPLAIGALMIGRGEIDAPGVQSPESCVDADSFLAELGKRGVVVYQGEDFAERIN